MSAGRLFAACLTLLLCACESDGPTDPGGGGGDPGAWSISVTADPPELAVGAGLPTRITVRVESSANGSAPPAGTSVVVSTTLGELGTRGSNARTAVVQLAGREGAIDLFAGNESGTAVVEARLDDSVGIRSVTIRGANELFLGEVDPASGGAEGGDRVTLRGGGFAEPLQVRFDDRLATVESFTASRIVAITPASSEPIPAGLTREVDVSVSVGAITRTLPDGFTYVPGGPGDGGGSSVEVDSVSPTQGTNAGGTRMTIEGSGFVAPVRVLFGEGDDAASFLGTQATIESTSATRIVLATPPAVGFAIDNRNETVDLLVQNVTSGEFVVVPEAFRYVD